MAEQSETIWTVGIREFDIIHRHARIPISSKNREPDPNPECSVTVKHSKRPADEPLCYWNLKSITRGSIALTIAQTVIRVLTENMRGAGIARTKATMESTPVTIEGHTYRVTMEGLMRTLFVVELDKDRRCFQWEFDTPDKAMVGYVVCRDLVAAYAELIQEPAA